MLLFCLKAILAGFSIAMAGLCYSLIRWLNETKIKCNSLFNFIGSIVFSLGLVIICKFKLYLFTGKVGFVFTGCNSKVEDDSGDERNGNDQEEDEGSSTTSASSPPPPYITYTHLILSLIINLLASFSVGILFAIIFKSTTLPTTTYLLLTHLKITLSPNVPEYLFHTLLQSIYCGLFVHAAVISFKFNSLFTVFFISAFVYNGFQHCIANAFYFGLTYYHHLSINMLINELAVIVGNVVGTIPLQLLMNNYNH